MKLKINADERELLLRLLDAALGDLHSEARRANTREFQERLKQEEGLLVYLLTKLTSV